MKSGATHDIDTNYLSFIYYTKSNPVHHFRVVNNILSLILDNSYTLVNMGVEVIEQRVSRTFRISMRVPLQPTP